jgi:hypothetical protein
MQWPTKFLRTLLERPDLASHVKTYSSDFPSIGAIERGAIEPHRAKIEKIMATVCTDERLRNNWYQSMFRIEEHWHDGGAIAALLILLLSRVPMLELPIELPLGVYMALVFSRACQLQRSGKPAPYCNLQHIEVYRFDNGNNFFDPMQPFLQLPSVQCLTFDDIMMVEEDFQGVEVLTHHITRLSFLRADIHPHTLPLLLKHFPNLTHFSYIHKCHEEISHPFIPRFIRDGVLHLQHSLEELIIADREKDPEEEWELSWSGETHEEVIIGEGTIEPGSLALGSLTGFKRLRRLEATVFTLVGSILRVVFNDGGAAVLEERLEQKVRLVESLPASLEELVLRNCESNIWSLTDVLFEKRGKGLLIKLKAVTLVLRNDTIMKQIRNQESARNFVDEGKKLGIVVTILGDLTVATNKR